jgi:hypothetical protein
MQGDGDGQLGISKALFMPRPRERARWPPAPPGGSALGQGAERRGAVWAGRSGWEGVGLAGGLWSNDRGKGGWEACCL